MPVKLERKLKAIAKKRGYGKERTGVFVYGNKTMQQHMRKKK